MEMVLAALGPAKRAAASQTVAHHLRTRESAAPPRGSIDRLAVPLPAAPEPRRALRPQSSARSERRSTRCAAGAEVRAVHREQRPGRDAELIRDLGDEAERRGFDGGWCNEHPIPAHEPDYEWPPGRPWKLVKWSYVPSYGVQTTLAYIAGRTKRVRLGCSVHPMPYYNPIMLAKSIATLDQLSDGRAILGTAVGWNRQEMEALGFNDFEERGAYTDESIEVIRTLWTEKVPSFKGRWTNFGEVDFEPKPVQKPHPPIWIGGESKPTIRRVAKYGVGLAAVAHVARVGARARAAAAQAAGRVRAAGRPDRDRLLLQRQDAARRQAGHQDGRHAGVGTGTWLGGRPRRTSRTWRRTRRRHHLPDPAHTRRQPRRRPEAAPDLRRGSPRACSSDRCGSGSSAPASSPASTPRRTGASPAGGSSCARSAPTGRARAAFARRARRAARADLAEGCWPTRRSTGRPARRTTCRAIRDRGRRAGKHVVVEKPLTGCFGSDAQRAATPRACSKRRLPPPTRCSTRPAGRRAAAATPRTGCTRRRSRRRAAHGGRGGHDPADPG